MLSNNFYIYRHIRPDTNEVFYIGKGNNLDKRRSEYRRAYQKDGRTDFWRSIVSKNKGTFIVEVMWNCETEQEANNKEIEFIELYGRKDLKMGTLVNLSSGGEGATGVIQKSESIAKRSGKNHYNYKGGLMDIYAKEKAERLIRVKVINVRTKETFHTLTQASKSFNINLQTLSSYLNGKKPNKTDLCLYVDYVSGDYKIRTPKKENKGIWRTVIDIKTNVVYDSIRQSVDSTGYKEVTVRKMLDGRMNNKTNLRYV